LDVDEKEEGKRNTQQGSWEMPTRQLQMKSFLVDTGASHHALLAAYRPVDADRDWYHPPAPFLSAPYRTEPVSEKATHLSCPRRIRRRPAQGKRSGGHLDAMHRISISVTYLLVRYAVLLFDTILYSAIISISTEPCFITYINIACSACHPTTYFFLSFISVYSLDPFEN
jgi:hypothetical protein